MASRHRKAEVAVVGAGPAGVAAALQVARQGRSVTLADEREGLGGQIWRNAARRGPARARRWLERLDSSRVDCAWEASVVSADLDARTLLLEDASGGKTVEFERLILATGARELFLPFPGWTLPGVVGVGALQAMIKSGARFDGQSILIAGSGPLLLPVAALAARAGAKLVQVCEQAPFNEVAWFAWSLWQHPAKALAAVNYRRRFLTTRYRAGTWIESVRAAEEDDRLEAILTDGNSRKHVVCDVVATSCGLVPASELGLLLGCAADAGGALRVDQYLRTSTEGVFAAGEVTGVGGADLAMVEGRIAGAAAVNGKPRAGWLRRRARLRRFATEMNRAFRPRPELTERVDDDTLVCRCEDIPWVAVDPQAGPRQTKLLTRCGMGLCQGRTCMPALKVLCGWQELPVIRPPIQPTLVSSFLTTPPDRSTQARE